MSGYQIAFTGLKRQYNNLREEILDATDSVLTSGILMNGPRTAHFELWLAGKNQTKYAAVCHSGTQALEIIASFARQRLGINPPTVLVPSMTFPASANAFVRAGWNLHFIDTDAYGNMDLKKIDPDTSYQVILGIVQADFKGEQQFTIQIERQFESGGPIEEEFDKRKDFDRFIKKSSP